MILNDEIDILTSLKTKDGEGRVRATWSTLKSAVHSSFQPANLSAYEASIYGINENASESRRVFMFRDTDIKTGMRAVKDGVTYEIKAVNHWNIHTTFLCYPVPGETV